MHTNTMRGKRDMYLKNVWVTVLLVLFGILQLSDSVYLRCYGESIDYYNEVHLEQAEDVLNSFYYDELISNFIYIFGFHGKVNGNFTVKVINALLKQKNRNVFVVNWEREANSITTLGNFGYKFSYIISGLPQSVKVGLELGRALERMSYKGFKMNNTHAMGHSLGAHILGNAGRYLVKVGKPLRRISGCDPAGALFDQYLPIMPALDKSCAEFVDTTFTDPGGYAMNSSNAHLAIWVNFGNFIYGPEENQVQPGCPIGAYEMISQNDLCSHNRCLELWIATWSGEELLASKAQDFWTWEDYTESGVVTETVLLGDHTDIKSLGNYFMNTTAFPPYQPT